MRETTGQQGSHRVVAALFDDANKLTDAVHSLTTHGFDRAQLSMLAHTGGPLDEHPPIDSSSEATALSEARSVEAAITDTDVRQLRNLGTGTAAAIGGIAAAGITFMSGGAAALAIGVATAAGLASGAAVHRVGDMAAADQDNFLREQIDKGGVILWVTLDPQGPGETHESKATTLLREAGAKDVRGADMPNEAPGGA